jgi:hypothetical protein
LKNLSSIIQITNPIILHQNPRKNLFLSKIKAIKILLSGYDDDEQKQERLRICRQNLTIFQNGT